MFYVHLYSHVTLVLVYILGSWPLGPVMCNVYVTCDVLACSSSILHMLFISIGRYVGIKNPIESRQGSSKRVVAIKIAIVWLMAMTVSSFITVLGKYELYFILTFQLFTI